MARQQRLTLPESKPWHQNAEGCWSLSLGIRGCKIRVHQRDPGGPFYGLTWIPGRGRKQVALGTTSRAEAREQALIHVRRLLEGEDPQHKKVPSLTLGALWERYRKEAAAYKRITRRTRDDRAASAKHLLTGLGEQKRVEYLTLSDVERFVEMRRTGQGWPNGRTTPPVKLRTVASDLQVLRAILLWATRVRLDDGSWLLRDYPLRGLKLPKEEDPKRPVATYDRYLALRRAMQDLATTAPQKRGKARWVRIELALVIAEATGARIGSINGLRWTDISFDPPSIRWRQEFDKRGRERVVPLPAKLTKELRRFKLRLGGNDGWLFPRKDGVRPWPREIFDQQLREAEKRAGLERMVGGVWHPWRRAWATARKNMPIVDVAAAGGWKDYPTLLKCYQHTDEQSMLRVMECATKVWGIAKIGEKAGRNDYETTTAIRSPNHRRRSVKQKAP